MLSRTCWMIALFLVAAPAAAESVWVGGLEGSDRTRVAYLARVAPLPGQRLGDGWAHSLSVDRVHYEYATAGVRVDGRSSSLKGLLLRELTMRPGTLSFGAGIAYQHVSLSPTDPGNDAEGGHVRPMTEIQWRSRPQATLVTQAFAQYAGGIDSRYANAFLGRRLGNGMTVGAQASTGGDPSYRVHGLALAFRGRASGQVQWSFHVGAQHQEGLETRPAVGIGLVHYRP